MSLWAITTLFNPSEQRLNNFDKFYAEFQKLNVPLMVVICDNRSKPIRLPLPSQRVIILDFHSDDMLWQKERLINIAVEHLPADCDKVLTIDCDLKYQELPMGQHTQKPLFTFEGMADRYLNAFGYCQAFSSLHYLDINDLVHKTINGIAYAIHKSDNINDILADYDNQRGPVSGGAWAFRREFLKENPLYEHCILGGGDAAFAWNAYGWHHLFERKIFTNPTLHLDFLKWVDHCKQLGHPGYFPLEIFHIWHGPLDKRNYHDRHKLYNDFDPVADLIKKPGKPLTWSDNARTKQLPERVKAYFESRGD